MIFNKRVAFRVPASDITHLDYRAENKNQTSDIIFHLLPSPYSVVIVYKCQTSSIRCCSNNSALA